jgi:hypothetical protein
MMQGLLALRDRRSFRIDKLTRCSPSWLASASEKGIGSDFKPGRIVAISGTVSSQIYAILYRESFG